MSTVPELLVTLINVGWGETIFLETVDGSGRRHFGLVDCKKDYRSSELFIRRYLERTVRDWRDRSRLFDFVLLTHAHADHYSGLSTILKLFGANRFLYPKGSERDTGVLKILGFCNEHPERVRAHQGIDRSHKFGDGFFGDVKCKAFWPPPTEAGAPWDEENPNNNSVVFVLTLDKTHIVLTGDCEAEEWGEIAPLLPSTYLRIFKVPHHGGHNGMFNKDGKTPWLDRLGVRTKIAFSTHIEPHEHPHPAVLDELESRGFRSLYRTDRHYHLTFGIQENKVWTKYSDIWPRGSGGRATRTACELSDAASSSP